MTFIKSSVLIISLLTGKVLSDDNLEWVTPDELHDSVFQELHQLLGINDIVDPFSEETSEPKIIENANGDLTPAPNQDSNETNIKDKRIYSTDGVGLKKILNMMYKIQGEDILEGQHHAKMTNQKDYLYRWERRAGAILNNYGCWCGFGEKMKKGKGKPVDNYDRKCKELKLAYDCVEIDVGVEFDIEVRNTFINAKANKISYTLEEQIEKSREIYLKYYGNHTHCVPWEVPYKYKSESQPGTSVKNNHQSTDYIIKTCTELNDNLCATNTCIVEVNFINELMTFTEGKIFKMYEEDRLDSKFNREKKFDHSSECVNIGNNRSDRVCCGPKNKRFPIHTDTKACCGVTSYNLSMKDCCEDGIPRYSCFN